MGRNMSVDAALPEMALPEVLTRSAQHTDEVLAKLKAGLTRRLGSNYDAAIGEHTTFILTGSGGRGEMTAGSDIDGYVVRTSGALDASDDAVILAATCGALEEAGLPALDRDGEFLAMKAASAVVDTLGSTADDHSNAFTLRMLFLLESRPLLGQPAYDAFFKTVSGVYRATAGDYAKSFQPFFLVNDIIRYWRTVLLNHENRLRKKQEELIAEGLSGTELTKVLLAHRRYRSQKLAFPRCLSCFSALAYLLALAPEDGDAITAEHERELFDLTPIGRLQRVGAIQPTMSARVQTMLELYAGYMERTDTDKKRVLANLRREDSYQRSTSETGRRFTEEMFQLIQGLGRGNRLHRSMLI
ncbi:MAG: DUF294 nucleotidyltransferase-like domain-containing protein [Polyangiales bacterium]